jgi:ABC-type dipeptide/oligopeptide/nickel transport system permease component
MLRYTLRRLAQLVPTVLGLVVVVFLVLRLAPGDPAVTALGENPTAESVARLRAQMGLDQPTFPALVDYVGGVLTGDLGGSIVESRSVGEIIMDALPVTLALAAASLLLAVVLGVTLGAVAAFLSSRGRDSMDHGLTGTAIVMESTPPFVLGLVGLLIFVLQLGWFPATGIIRFSDVGATVERLALPIAILAVGNTASIARLARTSVLEVLNDDYVRTARALGESPWSAMRGHALRNALLPVMTLAGITFGRTLGGTVVMELIFTLPGLGTTLLAAIVERDFPVVQGIVLVYAVLYVLVNLLTDLLYRRADPRVVLT